MVDLSHLDDSFWEGTTESGGSYTNSAGYIYENVAEGIETVSSFDHLLPSKTADFWIACYLRKAGNANNAGFLILYDTGYSATQGLFALAQTGSNTGMDRGVRRCR